MSITRDRQELWRLENAFSVSATNETQREICQRLKTYLSETCEHEWWDAAGWGGTPRGTHQCNWCHKVVDPDEWRAINRNRTTTEPRDPATVDTAHVEGGKES